MTRSSSKDNDGLPVAQSVWAPQKYQTAEEGEMRAELLPGSSRTGGAVPSAPSSEYDKKSDGLWRDGKGYHMTTGQGGSQSYWGRFNDASAEVLPDNAGTEDGFIPTATARPDDRQIRLAFIRKVYMILSAQLFVTFAMCAFMSINTSVRGFAVGSGMGLYYVNMIMMFVLICALHAYKRTYPINYYLLSAFTLCMSYLVGTVTAMYAEEGAADLVVEAVFITATVFIVLTLFTLQSKWDFSFMGAGLGMCLWIMILWGIFSMIFGFQTGGVYALLGSILFSLYIIYDTYLLAERFDPEDYIVAAIQLYLDLINLFLYILRLLSEGNRR